MARHCGEHVVEKIQSLFVQRPLNILAVAALFGIGYLLVRFSRAGSDRRHPGALLVPASGWALYAAWEWLILWKTPEANIRFDLLLIWPALLVLSVWFCVRAFR